PISTFWNGLRAGRPTGPCIRTVARDAGVTCIAPIAAVAVYVTITAPASGRTIKSLCMRRRRQDDWQQQRPRERRGAQKYKRAYERATIANCHGIPPVCRKQRFRGRPDRRASRENHRLPLRRVACVRHAHRPDCFLTIRPAKPPRRSRPMIKRPLPTIPPINSIEF
ncbi:hypothetical protein, partial [Mesorhizobium sp. M7A.F.Ca.US.007.01.2.1]|uniref:hypothetical protein n=1 Tax=Mesorhizobium sp. M7A.F.Ca.US.007.01.2.1 TaxID=2496711 RepID=UPI0019CFC03F